jgi:CHAT domain-containing protein
VWASKAVVSRALERRHLAARIALADARPESPLNQQWEELLATRRRINQVLLDPGKDLAARDRLLEDLTGRQDRLERSLAEALPEVARGRELDRLGPDDLAKRLPPHTALIDLVRYAQLEQDPRRPGRQGERRVPAYAAFVLTPGRAAMRVDLGPCQPLDEAVTAWRKAIDARHTSPAAAELSQRLWRPLARSLPAGTKTVYLAPDGDLWRVPWAALPGGEPGAVLLEEYTLALVPHAPFLLEKLSYPPKSPVRQEVLAVGGVAYTPAGSGGDAPYPFLEGTTREVRQLREVAGERPVRTLTAAEATVAKLRQELPRVRYAHLATHGYFDADALSQEHRREAEQRERLRTEYVFSGERTTARVGLGARSPLSYVGLALAGANRPEQTPERGVLTGEGLIGLPLEGLRLSVLSACETGLGGLTEGEGVMGLARAFHLSGCPDVVASLWKVDDDATAALMAKFYHALWAEQKPPIEALRQAQLTVYRHPERIAALARERGPNFAQAVKLPAAADPPAAPPAGKRAPTKLWAAFVLSGVGR